MIEVKIDRQIEKEKIEIWISCEVKQLRKTGRLIEKEIEVDRLRKRSEISRLIEKEKERLKKLRKRGRLIEKVKEIGRQVENN